MANGAGILNNSPTAVGAEFYVTGGTLRPDAPSYIERQADQNLCQGLLAGEFCYVLTSRQMGKSSLMVRAVKRLQQEGAAVAVLDLTAIGQNLTLEQWYDGLLSRLGRQLGLEDELLAFAEAHPASSPLQRWIMAIETVALPRVAAKLVIFIDEIDIVRSLPFSSDEFFAAIRECYNRRSRDSAFARLGFGLLGVATPTDLIRDTRMTPFNIGRRIELNDFTPQEAAPLARGLGTDPRLGEELLERVMHWTGGHPYLTQRLCRSLAEVLSTPRFEPASGTVAPPLLPRPRTVDLLAHHLFLSRQARDRDDNLIFVRERILRSEGDVAGLLYLYRKVHEGQRVPDDETNPKVSILRLSGVTRGVNGYLQVRNRVYRQVFDPFWVQTNMPEAEVRRQRRATRRGMLVGFAAAVVLLLAYLFFGPVFAGYRDNRLAQRTARELQAAYRNIQDYQDNFEDTFNIGLGGTTVPVKGSGSLVFQAPDKLNLALRSEFNSPESEIRLVSDGRRRWAYAPRLNQYEVLTPITNGLPFDVPPPLRTAVGPVRLLPLYRLLLAPPGGDDFLLQTRNLRIGPRSDWQGQPVRLLYWEQLPGQLLERAGITNIAASRTLIPVTAWVNRTNHLIVQLRMDLSAWSKELFGDASAVPVTSVILTEAHTAIRAPTQPASSGRFHFTPRVEDHQVSQLAIPSPDLTALASARRLFARLIPPRLAEAQRNLIDLTGYYNAALVQTWHSGPGMMSSNSLDILPSGLLQLGGVVFDVRGIVQLSGRELERVRSQYPQQITGMKIDQTCHRLHFLHACGWQEREHVQVGSYVLHYADARQQSIPIVYGEDVRDWNSTLDPSTQLKNSSVVWSATNSAGLYVRLFKTTWVNPTPDNPIATLDYVSTMSEAAPFLIAITAEE
ncbi:MAG TPA: AAA-like domain-containing protein [Verrucomicrobiae bacterium]|nr:AAA-like domain-containing protein [Verrucomicrobiae bacterium]